MVGTLLAVLDDSLSHTFGVCFLDLEIRISRWEVKDDLLCSGLFNFVDE